MKAHAVAAKRSEKYYDALCGKTSEILDKVHNFLKQIISAGKCVLKLIFQHNLNDDVKLASIWPFLQNFVLNFF